MRVLHVIPSLSLKRGGPSVALPLMARALTQLEIQVDVATTDDDGCNLRRTTGGQGQATQAGWRTFYFPKQTEFYLVSLPLGRWLSAHLPDYDLVHVHGLFSYASVVAGMLSCARKIPLIIRPLGVLNRWGMTHRRPALKKLSMRWFEGPLLRKAAAVHYTSCQEQMEAEAYAPGKGVVVPLGIDVAAFEALPTLRLFTDRFPEARGKSLILFLSRLDPKKGLDLLLPAFARIRREHPETLLVVAGDSAARLATPWRKQAAELGLCESVLWTGLLEGELRLSALAAASMFVLPSYSENFGIALVEAMAAGLPCVTTEAVGIAPEIASARAGFVVPCDIAPLSGAIGTLLADPMLRQRLGVQGRRLAQQRFSLERLGKDLRMLYEGILKD